MSQYISQEKRIKLAGVDGMRARWTPFRQPCSISITNSSGRIDPEFDIFYQRSTCLARKFRHQGRINYHSKLYLHTFPKIQKEIQIKIEN